MAEQLFKSTLRDLKKILSENNLAMTFDGSYPITLILQPFQGLEGQMNMLEAADADTPFSSPDAKFTLKYMSDDVQLEIYGRLALDDDLYRKIRAKFKTACVYYMGMIHKLAVDNELIDRPLYGGDEE